MRKRILRMVRWLHGTLLLAIIMPCLFALGGSGEEFCNSLYGKNLLIILPIMCSDIFVYRCKSVVVYFGMCVPVLLCTLAAVLGPESLFRIAKEGFYLEGETIFFLLVFWIECIGVMVNRFVVRANMPEEESEEEYLRKSVKESFLDKPSLPLMWYFGLIYAIGFFSHNNNLCNQAFFSGVMYLFPVLWYTFVQGMERYLALNKRTANLPGRRLYKISGMVMAGFIICMVLFSIPAIAVLPLRQNFMPQIKEAVGGSSHSYEETIIVQENLTEGADAFWSYMGESQGELPEWWNYLAVFIAICAAALLIWAVASVIRKAFASFQENLDENGDEVETLVDEIGIINRLSRRTSEPERNHAIRRRYRKMIRKHRKGCPAAYESPAEIEERAGLAEDPEMQELHVMYERVRYQRT